jgi:membrane protease YdiL (CAAX protease family)
VERDAASLKRGAAVWDASRVGEPSGTGPQPERGQPSRRELVLETWFVQAAFLVPGILSAVDALAEHLGGTGTIERIPVIVAGHPVANLVLATLTYLEVAAVVPLALLLLSRTGQHPAALGLTKPGWRRDIRPGAAIAVAGYVGVVIVTLLLAPLITTHKDLFTAPVIGHLPKYYIIYGIAAAATTSIAEETLVNGYLLTRLEQLGWDPRWAFAFSLTLRTSYHVYYGLGFLLTIPFGYFATRSFQKHRRLMPPIIAHFLYDSVLFTIAVLVP